MTRHQVKHAQQKRYVQTTSTEHTMRLVARRLLLIKVEGGFVFWFSVFAELCPKSVGPVAQSQAGKRICAALPSGLGDVALAGLVGVHVGRACVNVCGWIGAERRQGGMLLAKRLGMGTCRAVAGAVIILALSCSASASVIYDSNGFESFSLGALNGQSGWVAAGVPSSFEPLVIEPNPGNKAAILFSSDASATGSSMFLGFGQNLVAEYTTVTVSFDIFRTSGGSVPPQTMLWVWADGGDPSFGAQSGPLLSNFTYPLVGSLSFLQASTVFDRFATLEVEWDFASGTAFGRYDGNLIGSLPILSMPSQTVFGMGLANMSQGQAEGTGLDFALVDNFRVTGHAVPEPASLTLVALGALCGLLFKRRARRQG